MSQGEAGTSVRPWPSDTSDNAGTLLHRWVRQGRSFSGRERNCCFLNTHDASFADVSAVSGIDFADDGRAIAVTDWDHDGDLDLWIANRSSPQVRFLRNDSPSDHHYAQFRLRGRQCNRDAVGARVEVYLKDDQANPLIKTVRAGEGYLGQSSLVVHFGLGPADRIHRLVVHWPGGKMQTWDGLAVDQAYEVIQGESQLRQRARRTTPHSLQPAQLEPVDASDQVQRFLSAPMRLPPLTYETWEANERSSRIGSSAHLLVLWASWCQPCLDELRQLGRPETKRRLRQANIQTYLLSVDRLGNSDSAPDADTLQALLAELGCDLPAGWATEELLDQLQIVHNLVFDLHRPLPVPCAFLLDHEKQLAAIYKGPLDVDHLIGDVKSLSLSPFERRQRSVPLTGRWHGRLTQPRPSALAWALVKAGRWEDALQHVSDHRSALLQDDRYAPLLVQLGNELYQANRLEEAVGQYRAALNIDPQLASAYVNLAAVQVKQGQYATASRSLQNALVRQPQHAQARYQMGLLLLQAGQVSQAAEQLRRAVSLRPNENSYRLALASAATKLGDLPLAAKQLEVALTADDQNAAAWAQLGDIRARQNQTAAAIDCFHRAVRLRPTWDAALDSLAWLLVTADDLDLRDPERALQLAEVACRQTNFRHPKRLDTLAAAYAATGRLTEAVKTAERAEQLARRLQQSRLAEGIAQRLRRYRAGQPLVPME